MAVGPARLGRLRERDEQRRLGRLKPPRLLAEIGERGGADALDVTAIGRKRQVEIEDLLLREPLFQRQRRHIWRELAADARVDLPVSSRATCMVRVEPPETGRPCATN